MKIIVDKEGRSMIEQMCDVALKTGGIRNLQPVMLVLEKMSEYTDPELDKSDEKIIQTSPFPFSTHDLEKSADIGA